jgi:hypothetical protein
MTHRDKTRMLQKIVEVRAVQRQAAELKVAEANQALARLNARQAEQQEILRGDQGQWKAILSASSLSLSLVGAWSAEIQKGEVALRDTAREIDLAQAEKADRGRDWRMASARADAADELAARAETADRRRLEEARLNEVTDRFAHRVSPW